MEETLKEIVDILNRFDWVNFILSIATIAISIIAIIISTCSAKNNSKRDANVSLMQLRIDFYTDCINTYDFLKGSLSHLFNPNLNQIYTMLQNLENHESRLMKCTNTCKFIFNDDEIIYKTVKNLYLKFSEYNKLIFKYITEEFNKNEFSTFLKNKCEDINKLNMSEILKYSHEYGKSKNANIIKIASEIEEILSSNEFDNMFKRYINTKF